VQRESRTFLKGGVEKDGISYASENACRGSRGPSSAGLEEDGISYASFAQRTRLSGWRPVQL